MSNHPTEQEWRDLARRLFGTDHPADQPDTEHTDQPADQPTDTERAFTHRLFKEN